jgi:hypothetical protein
MSIRVMLLCLLAAGCTSWRTQRLAPQQLVSKKHPDSIRLTLTDSTVLELEHPLVSGDSIAGTSRGTRISVASDRVARSEVLVLNELKTTGAVFLYFVAYMWACNTGGGSPDCRRQRQ